MGNFVVYILEWTLCLSAFLLLYKMCFSGSTFHRFNRLFLLGSVVVSALLPLIHITTSEEMEPIAEVCRLNTEELEQIPVVTTLSASIDPQSLSTLLQERRKVESNSKWNLETLSTGQKVFMVLALIYLIYIYYCPLKIFVDFRVNYFLGQPIYWTYKKPFG